MSSSSPGLAWRKTNGFDSCLNKFMPLSLKFRCVRPWCPGFFHCFIFTHLARYCLRPLNIIALFCRELLLFSIFLFLSISCSEKFYFRPASFYPPHDYLLSFIKSCSVLSTVCARSINLVYTRPILAAGSPMFVYLILDANHIC